MLNRYVLCRFARKVTKKPSIAVGKGYIDQESLEMRNDNEESIMEKMQKYKELGYKPNQILDIMNKKNEKEEEHSLESQLNTLFEFNKQLTEEKDFNFKNEAKEIENISKIVNRRSNLEDPRKGHVEQKKPQKVAYDQLLDEIVDGSTLMNNKGIKENFNKSIAKKFTKEELELAQEERKEILKERGETSTFLKIFEDKNRNKITELDKKLEEDRRAHFDSVVMKDEDYLDLNEEFLYQSDLSKAQLKRIADIRAKVYADMLEVDEHDMKHEMRKEFFELKEKEEKDKEFEMRAKKRLKRKEIKLMYERLQKNDFEVKEMEEENIMKVLTDGYTEQDAEEDEEKRNQAMEDFKEKLSRQLLGLTDKDLQLKTFDYVKIRSGRNYERCLNNYFNIGSNKGEKWTLGHNIVFEETFVNANMHFVFAFWDFVFEDCKEDVDEINKNLNKNSKIIATYLFKEMGLRKPPILYLFKSRLNDMKKSLNEEYREYLPSFIGDELKESDTKKYEALVQSGNLKAHIDEQTEFIMEEANEKLENLITNSPLIGKLVKEVKRVQLQAEEDETDKPKKKKKNKKGKSEKADQSFWSKIMKGSI